MEVSQNSKEFLNAANYAKKINGKRNTEELKKLYGLYKQATVGDINIEKPSMLDFKGRDKWHAWNEKKGKSRHDSEVEYITFINELIKKYGLTQ